MKYIVYILFALGGAALVFESCANWEKSRSSAEKINPSSASKSITPENNQ